jgi:hypothetical protein
VDQAAREIAGVESPLREQEGTGGAAPAAVAVDDITLLGIELAHLAPQHVERHVRAAFDAGRLVLVLEAHVQPHRAFFGEPGRLVEGNGAERRLPDQLVEIFFRQAHELAVGQHGDRGVARGIRDECLFAEAVALAELGELGYRAIVRGLARHETTPGLNDVVVVAGGPLLDDDLAGLGVECLHVREDALDIGGGQPAEQIGAEHARHPIAAAFLLQIVHLHLTRFVVEAIVGEQSIEHRAIDLEYLQRAFRPGGKLPRLQLRERVAGVRGVGGDLFDQLAVRDELEGAVEDEEGEVVLVTLLEDVTALAVLHDLTAAQHLFLVLLRQAIDGNQLPNGVGELVAGRGHLAEQMLYACREVTFYRSGVRTKPSGDSGWLAGLR